MSIEYSLFMLEPNFNYFFSYFSSYQRVTGGWNYRLGDFAQQSLPLDDDVTLTVLRVNAVRPDTFKVRSDRNTSLTAF